MPTRPSLVTFRSAAGWAGIVLLLGLLACALLPPGRLRVFTWGQLPPLRHALVALAFLGLAAACRWRPGRALPHALMAATLGAAWISLGSQPLGDHDAWRNLAHTATLTLSEPLANLAFRLAQAGFGPHGLDYVAPCFGVLTALAYLGFVERAVVPLAQGHAGFARVFAAAAFVLSGLPLLFFRGYVENAFLSLPPLFLGLAALHGYADGSKAAALRAGLLARAGVWLALAMLVHGVSAPSLVAAACATACVHPPWLRPKAWAMDLARLLLVVLSCMALVLGFLWLMGFSFHEGHALGGADQSHFTPLVREGAALGYPFAMFDFAHFVDVGDILVCVLPLWPCLFLLARRQVREQAAELLDRTPALGVAAFGALLCTFLFGFDLGFPLDYDLMAVMPAPALLLWLQLCVGLPSLRRQAVGCLLLGGAVCTLVLGGLVVPPEGEHPLGARGLGTLGEPALLTMNGRCTVCAPSVGETLVCQLWPPAGAGAGCRFTLYFHRLPLTRTSGPMCFASPDEPDFDPLRTLPYRDGLGRHPGAVEASPLSRVFTWPRLPVVPGWGEVAVQALIQLPDGTMAASNAVLVRMPKARMP